MGFQSLLEGFQKKCVGFPLDSILLGFQKKGEGFQLGFYRKKKSVGFQLGFRQPNGHIYVPAQIRPPPRASRGAEA